MTQSIQNFLNQNLVKGNVLENGCKATLRSKTNILIVWKYYFSLLRKLFNDEVGTIFWESEVKSSRSFESNIIH